MQFNLLLSAFCANREKRLEIVIVLYNLRCKARLYSGKAVYVLIILNKEDCSRWEV